MANRIFETYKNSAMTHGQHRYQTAYDMDMAEMCAYPPSQHELPQCSFVLRCCANFPRIHIPSK